MSQSLIFVAMHLLGVLVAAALGLGRHPLLCCAFGFLVGVAVQVIVATGMMLGSVPYTAGTAAFAALVVAAAAVLRTRQRGDLTRELLTLAGMWTVGFASISLLLSSVNVTLLAFDSHHFVALGRIIGDDAGFAPGTLGSLNAWGVFLPIVHAHAAFIPEEYLWAFGPHVAVSFLVLFGLAVHRALVRLDVQRPRTIAVAVVPACLGTVFHFHHHFLFIHNNLGTAAYLFCFAFLFWMATMEDRGESLPLAFLCLAAVSLHRVENPVVALLFASVCAFPSKLSRGMIAPSFGAFVAISGAWYVALAAHAPAQSQFLTRTRCLLVVGMLVGVFALWLASAWAPLRRIRDRAPDIIVGLGIAALLLAIALKPAHMGTSIRNWLGNLVSGYWGLTWLVLATVTLLGSRLPKPPQSAVFTRGIAASVVLILLLAFGRSPYRARHVGDSANRMMLHLLPLVFFYFALLLAPLFASAGMSRSEREPRTGAST